MQNTERLGRHGFLFGKGKVDASIGSSEGKLENIFVGFILTILIPVISGDKR